VTNFPKKYVEGYEFTLKLEAEFLPKRLYLDMS